MPTDRVLVEIVTAANMAGIEQAQLGFLKLNASTIALAASLGGLVYFGKAAIDNTRQMDDAHKSLAQATDATRQSFDNLQGAFDTWAETNKRYLPDQYDAEKGFAAIVRSGAKAKDMFRELNLALDIATVRHTSVSDAAGLVVKVLAGSPKVLKEVGISLKDYNDIMKSHHTQAWKNAAILDLLEQKYRHGKDAQDSLQLSTQGLNKDWQDITTRVGPPLLDLLSGVADKVDWAIKKFDELGHDTTWNKTISYGFGLIQAQVVTLIGTVEGFYAWLAQTKTVGTGGVGGSGAGAGLKPVPKKQTKPGAFGFASTGDTGPFVPGARLDPSQVEDRRGGTLAGGIGGIVVNINGGAFMDHGPTIDAFANAILRHARFRPGT